MVKYEKYKYHYGKVFPYGRIVPLIGGMGGER